MKMNRKGFIENAAFRIDNLKQFSIPQILDLFR